MDAQNPPCPGCGALKTHKKEIVALRTGEKKQRYRCPKCGKTFYPTEVEA